MHTSTTSAKRRRGLLATFLIVPTTVAASALAVTTGPAASATQPVTTPDRGSSLAMTEPVATQAQARSSTHPLRAAEGALRSLDRADVAEARRNAGGRAVAVSLASAPVDLPTLAVVGVTWRDGSDSGTSAQYRTQRGGTWGQWTFVHVNAEHGPDGSEADQASQRTGGAREGTDPVIATNADRVQVRLVSPAGGTPAEAELMLVDPGSSPADSQPTTTTQTTTQTTAPTTSTSAATTSTVTASTTAMTSTVVPQPTIYTRAQWYADETLRDQSEPEYSYVDAAFVHHTAGSNDYASSQVPGIIRGIYKYHVTGLGWRDIGYNFLVDRFGRTWEGRYGGMDKAVVGAHATGANYGTLGVSVLGNFESASPNSGTLTALTNLIAWKADLHRFDVLGKATIGGHVYNVISGHKDAYNNKTACPGVNLYAKLPYLRTATAALSPAATRIYGSWGLISTRLSARTFAPGAPVAYVTNPSTMDASLGAGAAGGHLGGPLLFATKDAIPASTAAELTRLKPQRIVILGGSAGISTAVRLMLGAYAPQVDRITGADRYVLAAALSAKTFATGAPVAYVATGATHAQAVVAGAAGGHVGGPVLLTLKDSLPAATRTELQRLKPATIVIVGSSSAVSTAVATQLAALAPKVTRYWGAHAANVAASLSAGTFAPGVPVVHVATSATFLDALVSGAAGGHLGGPVLLTSTDSLPQGTINELLRLQPAKIIVVGQTTSVSKAVAQRLYNYEVPPAA